MIFREKNWALAKLYQIVSGAQIQKMFLEILFFGFVQGCTWYKICSLVCLQAEKEETVRETFLLLFLDEKQMVLGIFVKMKKKYITKFNFEFYYQQ